MSKQTGTVSLNVEAIQASCEVGLYGPGIEPTPGLGYYFPPNDKNWPVISGTPAGARMFLWSHTEAITKLRQEKLGITVGEFPFRVGKWILDYCVDVEAYLHYTARPGETWDDGYIAYLAVVAKVLKVGKFREREVTEG